MYMYMMYATCTTPNVHVRYMYETTPFLTHPNGSLCHIYESMIAHFRKAFTEYIYTIIFHLNYIRMKELKYKVILTNFKIILDNLTNQLRRKLRRGISWLGIWILDPFKNPDESILLREEGHALKAKVKFDPLIISRCMVSSYDGFITFNNAYSASSNPFCPFGVKGPPYIWFYNSPQSI